MDADTYARFRRIEQSIGYSQLAEFSEDKLAAIEPKDYPTEKTVDWRLFKLEQKQKDGGCSVWFLVLWIAIVSVPQLIGWWLSEASAAKYAEAEALVASDEHRHFVERAMEDGKMTNGEFFWMWPVAKNEASVPARESLKKRLYKP